MIGLSLIIFLKLILLGFYEDICGRLFFPLLFFFSVGEIMDVFALFGALDALTNHGDEVRM